MVQKKLMSVQIIEGIILDQGKSMKSNRLAVLQKLRSQRFGRRGIIKIEITKSKKGFRTFKVFRRISNIKI